MDRAPRTLLLLAAFILSGTHPVAAQSTKMEAGGSNYYAYYITPAYLAPCPCGPPYNDSNTAWLTWQRQAYLPGAFEHVVAGYHHHPDVVRQQLREMYAGGQRKVALLLHLLMSEHECFGLEHPPDVCHTTHAYSGDGSWGFTIPLDTNFELRPQHKQNLKNLINDLRQIGFNEVIIRFSTFGDNDPRGWRDAAPPEPKWNAYHTLLYDRYWSAVRSTIDSVNIWIPPGDSIQVLYDLNIEFSAYLRERDGKPWNHKYSTFGHAAEHARRLWRDYVQRYGNTRTIGFSFGGLFHPGAKDWWIKEIVADVNRTVYDVVGERPKYYGFDIYRNPPGSYAGLRGCKYPCYEKYFEELAKQIRRDQAHPIPQVLIIESTYNDPLFAKAVRWANEKLDLRIPYVMQWPARPTEWNAHITVPYPKDYDAYLTLSQ